MNGYLIQDGQGAYLTRKMGWFEHDDPRDAWVHPVGSLGWICKELQKLRVTLIPGQIWSKPVTMTPAMWTSEDGVVVTGSPEPFPWHEEEVSGRSPGQGTVFHEGYNVSFIIQEESGDCLKANLTWIPCSDLSYAFQHPQYALHYLTMVAGTWMFKPAQIHIVVNGKILQSVQFSFDFEEMAREVSALIG